MTREHEVQPRRLGRRSIMKAAGASLVLGAAEIRADQRQSTQTFGCTGLPRLGAAKPKPKDQTFLSDEGFKNTTLDGKKGFQVKLRVDYYRCMHLEEIESFSVKVDGKDVSPEDMVFILEDRRYKVAELQNTRGVLWQVLDYATLFVPKADGLSPGAHDVEVRMKKRSPVGQSWLTSGPAGVMVEQGKKRLTLEADL